MIIISSLVERAQACIEWELHGRVDQEWFVAVAVVVAVVGVFAEGSHGYISVGVGMMGRKWLRYELIGVWFCFYMSIASVFMMLWVCERFFSFFWTTTRVEKQGVTIAIYCLKQSCMHILCSSFCLDLGRCSFADSHIMALWHRHGEHGMIPRRRNIDLLPVRTHICHRHSEHGTNPQRSICGSVMYVTFLFWLKMTV